MIGKKLKELRKHHGYTQQQLAEMTEQSYYTITKYENDVRNPDLKGLVSLCKVFNVSSDYLLGLSNLRMDQDDLEFVGELMQYNGKKLLEYFIKKWEINYNDLNEEYRDEYLTILAALINIFEKSDLSFDFERDKMLKTIDILFEVFTMQFKPDFNPLEYDKLLERLNKYNEGEYSFINQKPVEEVDLKKQLTGNKKDDLKLLRKYIMRNLKNNKRALDLINRIVDDDSSTEEISN